MSVLFWEKGSLLTLMTAARMSWVSRVLSRTTYSVGFSSCPSHVIGPASAGASLSGMDKDEALLCRLSLEHLGLSKGDAMVWRGDLKLGFASAVFRLWTG